MQNRPISILFIEDLHIVRYGIKLLIKTQSRVMCNVSEASCLSEAVDLCNTNDYDVVLLDLSLPDSDYCISLRKLKELGLINKTLILTSNKDEQIIRKCFSLGSTGYILKNGSPEELMRAILTVKRGDKYYCSEAVQAVLNGGRRVSPDNPDLPNLLSKREFEVVQLIAKDYSNIQIAEFTHLSVRTVEGHRRNIRSKLNIKTTTGLIKYAMELMPRV